MEKDNLQKEEGNRMNMIQNDECTGANRIKKRRRRRLVTLPTQQDVKYPSSASVSYLPRTVFVEQSTGKVRMHFFFFSFFLSRQKKWSGIQFKSLYQYSET